MPFHIIKNNRIALRATAVSLLALSHAVLAQENSKPDVIEFSADRVTYDTENKTIQAIGRVHLERDGYILDAGEIFFNEITGELTASGAVELVTPNGDKVYAPRMVLEDNLKRAFIEDIRLIMTDGSQVRAASGNRDETSGITTLERAVYSPCKICMVEETGKKPLWQIRAVKVIHDKSKRRLYYKDAVLEVFGVPVAWMPTFSHPDPTVKRASGVLPLSTKITNNLGLYLGVPYYWAINDSQDLTVTPTITTKEGFLLLGEYRKHIGLGQFKFGGSITHGSVQREEAIQLGIEETFVPGAKGFRGHISTEGEFNHTKQWRSTYRLDYASDDTYLRRYDISDKDTLISEYRLEGFYNRSYFSARTIGFQGLRVEDIAGKTAYALPHLELEYISDFKPAGGTIALNANAVSLVRTAGQDTQRFTASVNWRRRWITPMGFVIDADGLARIDAYKLEDADIPDDVAFTGTLEGSTGTASRYLTRFTTTASWPLVKYLASSIHTIEPIVQFTLTPTRGILESVINEDGRAFELSDLNVFSPERTPGFDIWEDGTRMTYGLKWRYEGENLTSDIMIGQTWRINGDFAVTAVGIGLEGDLSDIVGRTILTYKDWLDIEHRYRLNDETFKITRNDIDVTIGNEHQSVRFGYLKLDRNIQFNNREDREEIRVSGFYEIDENWKLQASFIRRLKGAVIEGEPEVTGNVQYTIGLEYENECVAMGFAIRKNYTEDRDIQPGTSILFRLKLTNLG